MTTRDFHGWRKVFGVVTPAINTCVQPEYDALRPRGVSNQLARIQGSDIPLKTNEDFVQVVEDLYGNLDGAVRQVALCRPDHLILDSPDVEALVQFGANLPMAAVADEAERWLGKPVIAVNIATYWHALRHSGIADRFDGHTRLLADF